MDADQQMKFAFMKEGGMIDDGKDVEPTTGNEVPPGSLSEEVKDNVNATVPVGSYIVPADMVQFFGRKYFLDLIKKARKEMQDENP